MKNLKHVLWELTLLSAHFDYVDEQSQKERDTKSEDAQENINTTPSTSEVENDILKDSVLSNVPSSSSEVDN